MNLKKLLFGAVIFLFTFNLMVSCTNDSSDIAEQEELYGADKSKLTRTSPE